MAAHTDGSDRIVSIITSFAAGGAEVFAGNLSAAFVAAGHQATLVSLTASARIGHDPAFELAMRRRLADAGVWIESLDLASRRDLLTGAWRLRRLLRRIDPTVIHAHSAQGLLLLLLSGVRRPTIYTHHNIRFTFPPALFRLFDRIVDRYVAIGETCVPTLEAVARRPVVLIRNGAPQPANARARAAPSTVARVLAVGSLTAQKDYPTLVAATEAIVATGPAVRIEVAGGGDAATLAELRQRASPLGDALTFLGTRDDVPRLMAQADLLVNSSIYEGLPITLIEAAMAGLPIVATDVGGNREVVEPGVNGILVPPSDPAALAEAIRRVLSDPAEYARLSRGSLDRARNFTIQTCAAKHLALYAEVRSSR